MDSTTNGQAPGSTQAQVMHDWYMAEDGRTMADVARRFGLSVASTKRRFADAELACKPRGGRRAVTVAPTVAAPEVECKAPVDGIAAAVVALERERMAVRLRESKLTDAIDALRGLAA